VAKVRQRTPKVEGSLIISRNTAHSPESVISDSPASIVRPPAGRSGTRCGKSQRIIENISTGISLMLKPSGGSFAWNASQRR